MENKEVKIFIEHIDKFDLTKDYILITEEDKKRFLEALLNPPHANEELKKLLTSLTDEEKNKIKDYLEKNTYGIE